MVLLVLVLLTAAVIEFSYSVYVDIGSLSNWRIAEQLSLATESGISAVSALMATSISGQAYTYPGYMDLPADNIINGVAMTLRIEDENSKFNLNTTVYPNGEISKKGYEAFTRLLAHLSLDPEIADRVADWVDKDNLPEIPGSETRAKNSPMLSVDELLLVPGISRADYDKLIPYVTVHGNGLININGAEVPVLVTISSSVDADLASRLISWRDIKPFEKPGHITRVAGFESIGLSLMGSITVKGSAFRVVSTASSGGIKRIVECVMDTTGKVKYWKEY